MALDAKSKRLLDALFTQDGYSTLKELGLRLGMGRRSVQHALDALDVHLAAQGLPLVRRVAGRGVRLDDDAHDALALRSMISPDVRETVIYQFADNPLRRLLTLFAFACSEKRIGAEALADMEEVSERTVRNDIQDLREYLSFSGVTLEADHKLGYRLCGDEFVVRNLLVREISGIKDAETVPGLYQLVEALYRVIFGHELTFSSTDLEELNRYIVDLLPGGYDHAICRALILHVLVIVMRGSDAGGVSCAPCDRELLTRTSGYEIARLLRTKASELLRLNISEDEDWGLALLLKALPAPFYQDGQDGYPFEFEVVAQKLIASVKEGYGFDFSVDADLLGPIVHHLASLSYRMLFNAQTKNPMMGEIVQKYGRLHSVVRAALADMERATGRSITEDEIAFLTLYFASSIEKVASERRSSSSIVIVCNSGNAVSRLLQYRLMAAFSVRVQATSSTQGLEQVLLEGERPDLIVTVVDLNPKACQGIPVVKVSPLLTGEDFRALEQHLVHVDAAEGLAVEEGMGLLDLVDENRFALDVPVTRLDDLIRAGGNLLCDGGLCDKEYVLDMVTAAHGFGPLTTILIAPDLIMPHAGITDHVYKTGFSFVRTAHPVSANGKPVLYALSLCTRDKRINQFAIKQLSLLLRGGDFLAGLRVIKNYQEFCGLITTCLKQAEREWKQ